MKAIIPETADLTRITLILSAIRDGMSPHEACGLSERQASYAIQTALAMGFLSRREGEYALTASAHELLAVTPNGSDAKALLRRAILGMEFVKRFLPKLLDESLSQGEIAQILEEHPESALARTTAEKRASAMFSWRKQLSSIDAAGAPPNLDTALVIHLSDIHFQADGPSNPVAGRVDAIAKCVAARFAIRRPDACFMAITGDIAYSGSVPEYRIARLFLDSLARLIESALNTKVYVVLVPGNHDCDFSHETSVRTTVLDAIAADRIDQAIIDEGAKLQAAYFEFARAYHASLDSLYEGLGTSVCSLRFGNRRLRFDRYNTAWCSRKHEQQGHLYFPLPVLPSDLPECDAVIAMLHHPYNWLNAEQAKCFQDHVDTTADLVLTGHEHVGGRYRRIRETGEQTEYVEGRVLQQSSEPNHSGFNAILLDFNTSTQESVTFTWGEDDGMYRQDERFPPRPFLRAKWKARHQFPVCETFQTYLCDAGEPYTHPKKLELQLEDIFIYPDLRPSFISRPGNGEQTTIKEPLFHVIKEQKLLLLGQELVGKTSLAKRLFVDLHREGIIPILIQGADITSADLVALERVRDKGVKSIFGETRLERYLQLPPEKRALIIDDAHRAPLTSSLCDHAITQLGNTFGVVVVIADSGWPVSLLDAQRQDNESVLGYSTCSIEPLGHAKRYQLIEKWCYLGRRAGDDVEELSRHAQQLDEMITHAIGSSLLPTLPAIVLLCIQQIETARDSAVAAGSFGHLYDALITHKLWNGGESTIDVDAKRKFLSLFAYTLYANASDVLDVRAWEGLYEAYAVEYDIAYSATKFLLELSRSGLIAQSERGFCFRYKYAYCFFVAEYFTRASSADVKGEVAKLAKRLHHDESANILLFMAHLDRDGSTQELLLQHSRALIEFPSDYDVHKRLLPLGASGYISQLVLDGDTPEKRRVIDRERRDLAERDTATHARAAADSSESEAQQPREIMQFIRALRTVHILGQMLKGASGSTVAERKRELLDECYSLSARNIISMISLLVDHHAEYAAEVGKLILQQRPELADDFAAVKDQIRLFLVSLCESIFYGVTLHVSRAVGTPSLVRTYDRVVERHPENQVYQMFDLAIRLDHFSVFPEDKTSKLQRALVAKQAPLSVLRRLVWRHLYLFPVRYDARRSLCERFDIKENRLLLERRRSGAKE